VVANEGSSLLPKANLHLHLEGSARLSTILDLAETYGIPLSRNALLTFSNFAAFSRNYDMVVAVIQTPADLRRIVHELLEDEASSGALYIEPMVAPSFYSQIFGCSLEEVWQIIHEAFVSASKRTGVEFGLMIGLVRGRPWREIESLAQLAIDNAAHGVVALGMAGSEDAAGHLAFAEVCAAARKAGLKIVPHAGEMQGSDSVRAALEYLDPHRIAHGVRAIEDTSLIETLKDRGITLDICPTSNVRLGITRSLANHPLPQLLKSGVRISIGSDDQLFFGSTLAHEYEIARDVWGLRQEQLVEVARRSVEASGATPKSRVRFQQRINEWLADESHHAIPPLR
jgi:adenosine deaminase